MRVILDRMQIKLESEMLRNKLDFGQKEEHAIRLPTSGSFWRGRRKKSDSVDFMKAFDMVQQSSMTNFGLLYVDDIVLWEYYSMRPTVETILIPGFP